MGWEKTVRQIVRESHAEGAMDMLRRLLDEFDREPHVCLARDLANRLYADPEAFSAFVHDSQAKREGLR